MISAAPFQLSAAATADDRLSMHSWPSHRFRAMGSEIGLWLDGDSVAARTAFRRVEDLFTRVEARLTRFNQHSELCRLNALSEQWVPVSGLLWDVIRQALALAQETAGLFDPTLLPALEATGYTHSFSRMARETSGTAASARLGRWFDVRLNPARQAIWLPAEVRLDLGGIGKGYTAELARALLAEAGPALVDAGGDLVAGSAPRGFPGWPVAVAAPAGNGDEAADLFHLWLAESALATSGTDYRRWRHNGQTVHHLIDPRSGRPAESDVVTATVLAPAAITAEGWATAALIAGQERGLALLLEREMAGALTGAEGRTWLTPALAARVVWPAL